MSVRKLMSLFAVKAIIIIFHFNCCYHRYLLLKLCAVVTYMISGQNAWPYIMCIGLRFNLHNFFLGYSGLIIISLIQLWNNKTMEWVVIRDNANL